MHNYEWFTEVKYFLLLLLLHNIFSPLFTSWWDNYEAPLPTFSHSWVRVLEFYLSCVCLKMFLKSISINTIQVRKFAHECSPLLVSRDLRFFLKHLAHFWGSPVILFRERALSSTHLSGFAQRMLGKELFSGQKTACVRTPTSCNTLCFAFFCLRVQATRLNDTKIVRRRNKSGEISPKGI